ncbi:MULTISPECIES: hypothetical protein [unclassified Rhizobacter]|uniref:hypothetical protein n=1 Tax=unclassified Rhizobacter TaxID=2640088 RepID=UPI0012FAB4FD|nr:MULTISPECIES: hypothetical protein [unclassified Rhizobacter]
MAKHTLYAYALPTAAPLDVDRLIVAMQSFIASRKWTCPEVWPVNQGTGDTADVGLNMVLPDPGSELPGWFEDVAAVAMFCARSRPLFSCNFVIGAGDGKQADEITEIDSDNPRIDFIRRFLG